MLRLLVALQLGAASPPPDPASAARRAPTPADSPSPSAAPVSPTPAPVDRSSPEALLPASSSAPSPPSTSSPSPASPPPSQPPTSGLALSPPTGPPILPADIPVHWFLRGSIGVGPPAFSDQADVLSLEGYGGAKLWVAADGGYFAHPNVGVGGLVAFSRWSSAPVQSHPLEENSVFVCIGAPVRFGSRTLSFLGSPRLGLAIGKQTLGGDAPSQTGFAWGLDVSAVSFRYHLSVTAGLLFAGVGPPGELGRTHNLGGLWLGVGGVYGHER